MESSLKINKFEPRLFRTLEFEPRHLFSDFELVGGEVYKAKSRIRGRDYDSADC